MRRDPLFYRLFAQSPELLFDLIDQRPDNAANYRFDAVGVKEPKFEIDGVFLPPESDPPGTVFFAEVQMQKDETLYERLFSESSLYFYRNRSRFSDWQAVVIYPSRSIEQSDIHPFRALLSCDQFHRIYLDELGDPRSLPLSVAALVLTIVEPEEAPEVARSLILRAEAEPFAPEERGDIIELVLSILTYKFATLSQMEIREMLGINLSEEPRAIREAREEGREEQAIAILSRQLTLRLQQEIPESLRSRLTTLSLPMLDELSAALLNFNRLQDLETWLNQHS
jgi:predicted transposase/invertase (TIGR01784 family)